jgi:DNA-binding response OmpR family regulator
MKILAVDDDPLSLELLAAAMASVGYADVTAAGSAAEAREIVFKVREPFDCFLIDVQMPGTDGIELCRMLRRMPAYATTPVIMVTALSAKPYLDRAFAAGATDYVTKPYDLIELGARVRQAERHHAAEQRIKRDTASVLALRAELEESRRVGLDEAISLSDVESAIDYLALENYLLRLSRGDLIGTSIFTFRIGGIETLHARCGPTLFRDLLSDVADSILQALVGNQCLVAYAGYGIFAAVVDGGFGLDVEEVAVAANQAAEQLWLEDGAGNDVHISLVPGAPEHLGVMTTGRGAVNTLRLAIERLRRGAAGSDADQPRRRGGFIGALLKAV